jgi:hypothetical protein
MDVRIQFEVISFSCFRTIIDSVMPIVIEMDNTMRFVSQGENNYK